jgi:hypothetical protein
VNFVGHIATGLRARPRCREPGFLVGTALPDFASMARIRLGTASGALGRGIALHHAADAAFHAEDWFLGLERDLRTELLGKGLPDGAARACAHAGPELLLDGALVAEPGIADAVRDVWDAIGSPDDDVLALVPMARRSGWCAHLVGVAARLDPFGYADAAVVARRLHGLTSRRPRLAFHDSLVDAVTVCMAAVQPRIRDAAPAVLARVAAAVDG